MGCSESQALEIYDREGKPLPSRRCIVLLSPPSFETSKFIQGFPPSLKYKYVSVGKLIRDEINKKTHYSKIIMQNLAKSKKINDKILQVLLKNTALQGNFIIHFCPKDNDDLDIWRKFLKEVLVDLVVILKTSVKHEVSQQKTIYDKKLKDFSRDVRNVKDIFDPKVVKEFQYDQQIYDNIVYYIQKTQKSREE